MLFQTTRNFYHNISANIGAFAIATILIMALAVCSLPAVAQDQTLDESVALVADRVITKREFLGAVAQAEAMLKQQGKNVANRSALAQEVMQELIVRNLQLSEAERIGLVVDPQQLEKAILQIAQNNRMAPAEMRRQIEKQGQGYEAFRKRIKEDLLIRNLRQREVIQKIEVSEDEINQVLREFNKNADFRYSYLRITLNKKDKASEKKASRLTARIRAEVRKGQRFSSLAEKLSQRNNIRFQQSSWKAYSALPESVKKYLMTMAVGDFAPTIRSAGHLFLLKLDGKRHEAQPELMQKQYQVRHIVIQSNVVNDDDKVTALLEKIKQRLKHPKEGQDFAYFAKKYSQDPGSGFKGGSLGWAGPASMVPEFSQQMTTAPVDEIIGPFRTQFGWHLLVVEDVREQDISDQTERNKIISNIRQQKAQEEIRSWLLRLREKHHVDVRI